MSKEVGKVFYYVVHLKKTSKYHHITGIADLQNVLVTADLQNVREDILVLVELEKLFSFERD